MVALFGTGYRFHGLGPWFGSKVGAMRRGAVARKCGKPDAAGAADRAARRVGGAGTAAASAPEPRASRPLAAIGSRGVYVFRSVSCVIPGHCESSGSNLQLNNTQRSGVHRTRRRHRRSGAHDPDRASGWQQGLEHRTEVIKSISTSNESCQSETLCGHANHYPQGHRPWQNGLTKKTGSLTLR